MEGLENEVLTCSKIIASFNLKMSSGSVPGPALNPLKSSAPVMQPSGTKVTASHPRQESSLAVTSNPQAAPPEAAAAAALVPNLAPQIRIPKKKKSASRCYMVNGNPRKGTPPISESQKPTVTKPTGSRGKNLKLLIEKLKPKKKRPTVKCEIPDCPWLGSSNNLRPHYEARHPGIQFKSGCGKVVDGLPPEEISKLKKAHDNAKYRRAQ